ncbi:hypothetical protein ADEAN_000899100 [Angomonas deanei]|uniref:Uncharacterized protein n=1 Tax=Angomonas deanei TaxID=59799 RepID=A0A7G2CQ31_9TRYP|nr:hypothetical protein ADEAN_000899100 [Angomonas deanei]
MRQVKNRINPKVVRKLAELVKKAHRTAQADRPFSLYDDYPGRSAIDEVDIQRLLLCPWVQESVHLFEGANEEGEPRSLSLLSEDEHSVTGRFFNVARSSDLDIFSVTVLGFPRWRGGIHYDSVYNGESSLFIVNRLLWGVQQREERAFAAAASQHSFLDVIKGLWSSWIHDNSHDDRPSLRFQPYHKVWTSYPSVLLNEIAADLTQYTALAEEESGEEVVKLLKVCGGEESRPKVSPSKRLRVSFNTTKLDVWE